MDDAIGEVLEFRGMRGSGEGSGQSAREGIAGSGGVGHVGEGVGRGGEEVAGAEEHGSVFAFFDDHVAGAHCEEAASGGDEVAAFREHAGFVFIDDEEVDALHEVEQSGSGDIDPEVHAVGDDEWLGRALVENGELVVRAHVGEEDDPGGGGLRGEARVEFLEDVDGDVEGFAVVHVLVVFAGPAEGAAFDGVDVGRADAAAGEEVAVFCGEVGSDDGAEVDFRGKRGGERGVGSASAEEIVMDFRVGVDGIEGDGTGDEDRHGGEREERSMGGYAAGPLVAR